MMAPALPQPTECWSPTDQIIIEHLLFPLDAADSPCDGGGFLDMQSRPAEPVSLATITGLAIAQSSLPSPRRSAELMRLTSEEERKQRHRVAQQRFMQRKKVAPGASHKGRPGNCLTGVVYRTLLRASSSRSTS